MKSRRILSFLCISVFFLSSCGKSSPEQIRPTSNPTDTLYHVSSSTRTASPSETPRPTSTQTPSKTPTPTPTPSPSVTPFLFAKTPLTPLLNGGSDQSLVRLTQIKVPSRYSAIIHFSPYHPVMYFTGAGLLVKRLDLTSNDNLTDLLGPVHSSPAFLATSHDGLLLAGSDMNRVIVWDLPSGSPVQILEPTINALRGLYFTEEDDILVTVDYDGNIIQWDRWSWEEISRTELHREQKRVIFTPSGLILDDIEGVLPVVDLDGQQLSLIELPTLSYRFLSVSQDGEELMIQVHEGVMVFDISTGEEVSFLPVEELRNADVTPNWSLLAASDADHNVHIIDLASGDYLLTQKMEVSSIRRLEISPVGNLLGLYVIGPDQKTPYIELWGLVGQQQTE